MLSVKRKVTKTWLLMDSCFNHRSHLLHAQINIFRAKDAQAPFEYDELHFDNLIKQIDPQLWNAVCLLTRSTSEMRHFQGE